MWSRCGGTVVRWCLYPYVLLLRLEVSILLAGAATKQPPSAVAAAFAVVGQHHRRQHQHHEHPPPLLSCSSGLQAPGRRCLQLKRRLNLFPSSNQKEDDGATSSAAAAAEIEAIERQVLESARATVDVNRVLRALETDDDFRYDNHQQQQVATPTWSSHLQIAAAASLVAGCGTFVVFQQNYYLALFVAGFVFVTAFLDEDDTVAGALARILGRTTLRSLEASQPRVKALARAVVTGEEENALLRRRAAVLAAENAELRQWKERRIRADEALPKFKVGELRSLARENGLVTKGTKMDLLVRLVEAGALDLD